MIRSKFLLLLIASLFSTGCSTVDCDQLTANKISQDEDGFDFNIYKGDGSYWGEFVIYSVDRSISHTNNSMQKFRVDINDLEFVRFEPIDNAAGRLAIKWKNRNDSLCIATLPENYWNQMVEFVNDWPESKTFIVSNE